VPIPARRHSAPTQLLTEAEQIDGIRCQVGEQVLFPWSVVLGRRERL
jgi:hypothetical protein